MSLSKSLAVRCGLVFALLIAPAFDFGLSTPWQWSVAFAETPNSAEKDAFEAAKALGTVEAWDAFLSNYSTGFHADLARAYVKKLANEPAVAPQAAPPAAPATVSYPSPAGSWGGVVRDGPGQHYRQVDSLKEGDPVTLLSPTDVMDNGYPWFRISYPGGGSGYQWGGILCSMGPERPDLFKTCTTAAQRQADQASRPQRCRDNGGEWDGDQCRAKGYSRKSEKEPKPPKVNKTGVSCKELKARCSRTDSNKDCDRYLDSCTGKGDN